MTGLQALFKLGVITQDERNQLSVADRKWAKEEKHIRPFLESYFAIPQSMLATTDKETIVCRCEEITAGQIHDAVENGHKDSNQVKFVTRCGMGACQGRQCFNAVAHIVADAGGQAISEQSHFRGRPPVAPLTLEQLSGLYEEEAQ